MQRSKSWKEAGTFIGLVIGVSAGVDHSLAANKEYFVFSGERVAHSSLSRLTISVGEKLPIKGLKQRFSGYVIRATAGEDCLFCATVTGKAGSFSVNYDESGTRVTSIYSNDSTSTDALGNSVGASLRAILGETAKCDSGLMLTCKSRSSNSLSYIVRDDDKCEIKIPDEGEARIPYCEKISGFMLYDDRLQ